MTEENNTQEDFNVEAYATILFGMLSPETGYAVGPEVVQYIVDHPVADTDQELVSVALKQMIDSATEEVAPQTEEAQDETPTEEPTDSEPDTTA